MRAVCQSGSLLEHRHAILCSGCALHLNLAGEGLGLDHVRAQLADAIAGHSLSGCTSAATFSLEQHAPGAATLFMHCNACGALQVVV